MGRLARYRQKSNTTVETNLSLYLVIGSRDPDTQSSQDWSDLNPIFSTISLQAYP